MEAEKEASGTFVMPEGLSRKEQKKLLADQKRARHKAALRLKKAKIAERRRKYKAKKEARSGGSDDSSGAAASPLAIAPRSLRCAKMHPLTPAGWRLLRGAANVEITPLE